MLAEIMEPQRRGLSDQETKDPVAGGKRADPAGQVVIDADGDEVTECVVLADDAQSAIACLEEIAGGSYNPLQHGFEAQILRHGHHRFQQPPCSLLRLEQFSRPGHEVFQEIFQLDSRRARGLVACFLRRVVHRRLSTGTGNTLRGAAAIYGASLLRGHSGLHSWLGRGLWALSQCRGPA
ncbi:hypothetical protein StoSoilB5_25860 [Arthrobacter sp. StoSoilB5]|nr:hypothetical protein StoSoilB5_25860 [Arthrobacter sp. StoSoilB5]